MSAKILFYIVCIRFFLPTWDAISAEEINYNNNIGFMKPKPRDLAKKFPMCDAFLKVDWIDKKKNIGYSQYEVFMNKTGERKMMWALVYVGTYPVMIDVYQYKRVGKLKELFNFIRDGNISQDESLALKIRKGHETKFILPYGPYNSTLTENKRIVCIPYPNRELVWIFEARNVENLTDEEKMELSRRNDAIINGALIGNIFFQPSFVMDINHDGTLDFISRLGSIIYSFQGKYYKAKIDISGKHATWAFPPFGKKYTMRDELGYAYLVTTDGKDYYLANQINISTATIPLKEEE